MYSPALVTINLPNINADNQTGVLTGSINLPNNPPGAPFTGFSPSGPVYLGLALNGARVGPLRGLDWDVVNTLPPQTEAEANDALNLANPLNSLTGRIDGGISARTDVDYYRLTIPSGQSGELTAQLHPTVSPPPGQGFRLSLRDTSDNVLMASDGQATTADALIVQSLPAGTYYLRVEGINNATGNYILTTQFLPGPLPNQPGSLAGLLGDLNGDGTLDLLSTQTNSLQSSLGVGDGFFRDGQSSSTTLASPAPLLLGDFNGDGRLDAVVANTTFLGSGDPNLYLFLGNGDGTFTLSAQPPFTIAGAVGSPRSVVAGDFDGDGKLDLAAVEFIGSAEQLVVFLGNGAVSQTTSSTSLGELVVGDFTGDGKLDLICSSHSQLFAATGDGHFQIQQLSLTGTGLIAADLNGDGHPDLVVNVSNGIYTTFLNDGRGTFRSASTLSLDLNAGFATAGDVDADGRIDIVVGGDDAATLFRGLGDGTFLSPITTAVGVNAPAIYTVSDLNGDGRVDLTGGGLVLLGNGDGSFLPGQEVGFAIPNHPAAVVSADFDHDNILDLAIVQEQGNSVTIVLGNGDGTFRSRSILHTGSGPDAIAFGDFNGDNLTDLVVANAGDGTLSLYLGIGDGTFRAQTPLPIGPSPIYMVVNDFNGDHLPDIATGDVVGHPSFLNTYDNFISILLGNGDGSFQSATTFAVDVAGSTRILSGLVAEDLNGDLSTDLALTLRKNPIAGNSDAVKAFLNDGKGHFPGPAKVTTFGSTLGPLGLVGGNLDGDNHLDLAFADLFSNAITVLHGNGDGSFTLLHTLPVGAAGQLQTLAAATFTSSGNLDLVWLDGANNKVGVFTGDGLGNFTAQPTSTTGNFPDALAVGDFNLDSNLDIAAVSESDDSLSVLHGDGTGQVQALSALASGSQSPTSPIFLTNSQVPDLISLTAAGALLFREALPDSPGTYKSPTQISDPTAHPVSNFTVVSTNRGPVIAALDTIRNSSLHYEVSLYHWNANGTFNRSTVDLAAGDELPSLILAASFTGPNQDLVIYSQLSGTLTVLLSNGSGGFLTPGSIAVGTDFTGIATAPGKFGANILLTNQLGGTVQVLHNDGTNTFDLSRREVYRGATGLFGFTAGAPAPLLSLQKTAGLAVANFTEVPGGAEDVVTINPASHSLSLLRGRPASSYLNPTMSQPLGYAPIFVSAGSFNSHAAHFSSSLIDSFPDLAVLDPDNGLVHIYLGDGLGGFSEKLSPDQTGRLTALPVGVNPIGLSVTDVNNDGVSDLVVGNSAGDVFIFLGNGDGTFRPVRSDSFGQTVALVQTTTGAITANQANSDVTAFALPPGAKSFTQSASIAQTGVVDHPGNVVAVDLNGDHFPDLIIPNTGSNSITVKLAFDATGNNYLLPQTFFVGTNPVGIAVRDLNGDNIPDIAAANEGSNDVSILYGTGSRDAMTGLVSNWGLSTGPRYAVGAGPTSVTFADVAGRGTTTPDGAFDLVVSNAQDGSFTVLPGIGASGFFDGTRPITVNLPSTPAPAPGRNDIQQVDFNNNLVLTGGGSIFRVEFSNLANFTQNAAKVFSTPAGGDLPNFFAAATAGAQTVLFVGTEGGAVDVLGSDAQGKFSDIAPPITQADLHNISELAIADDEGSTFELYATNVGEDTPVVIGFQFPSGGVQPAPDVPLPGQQQPGADLTSTTLGSLETVATLGVGLPELVSHESDLSGFSDAGQVGDESLHGILVATATVVDEGEAALGGDGETVIDSGGGLGGEEPALEEFIAGVPEQLREVLTQQERSVNPTGFDDQWQIAVGAVFNQGDDFGAGLRVGAVGVLGELQAPGDFLTALGSKGTGEEFDWQSLWGPASNALRQIGASASKVTGELGPQFLAPRPEGVPARTPLLDTPLPKPIGGEAPPAEPTGPQGQLPEDTDDRRTATLVGLTVLLGQAFGRNGPFAGDKPRTGMWRPEREEHRPR